ncbi:MAG: hypothetical protein CO093_02595 [Alphaproteobacteria bacterium CG_4_9_14_3_um_filter_47_13]|nr:MAG: hypothetical protein CO093_02595 [Alphaproteobacteria bacterium CG_4_9_14_3_um_filter_47_13]
MEDPLPMARVILEKNKGDITLSRAFIHRQLKAAKTDALRKFWSDVDAILGQADDKSSKKPGKKALFS